MCLFLILRFSNSPTLDINMNYYVFAYDLKLHVSCMAERHLFTLHTMWKYCYLLQFDLTGENTVKPNIFTTFLFSRLSRIRKISEIKKSEKFCRFSYLTVKFGVCRAVMGTGISRQGCSI